MPRKNGPQKRTPEINRIMPALLTTTDYELLPRDSDDIEQNALIYLYQLNQLQIAERNNLCRQIMTLGIFNEGATHRRNQDWIGMKRDWRDPADHFTRLIDSIYNAVDPAALTKHVPSSLIKNISEIYDQAFGGCLRINSMGSTIGQVSSYHVMLRRWMLSVNNLRHSDKQTVEETIRALEVQYRHYKTYLTENLSSIDPHNYASMKIN